MVITHIITHSLFYGVVVTWYLFLVMITFSPRVWGYQDYPDIIKKRVSVQTGAASRRRPQASELPRHCNSGGADSNFPAPG